MNLEALPPGLEISLGRGRLRHGGGGLCSEMLGRFCRHWLLLGGCGGGRHGGNNDARATATVSSSVVVVVVVVVVGVTKVNGDSQ